MATVLFVDDGAASGSPCRGCHAASLGPAVHGALRKPASPQEIKAAIADALPGRPPRVDGVAATSSISSAICLWFSGT
jgi:hypothetical protein